MASICRDSRRPSSSKSIHSPPPSIQIYSAHPYDPVPYSYSSPLPPSSNPVNPAPTRTRTPPISRPIPTCLDVGRPSRNHGLRDVELWEVESGECYPYWDPVSPGTLSSQSSRTSPSRMAERVGNVALAVEEDRIPVAGRQEAPKPVRRALLLTEKDEIDEKARLKELYNETASTAPIVDKGRTPLLPTHTAAPAAHSRSWKHPLSLLRILFKCLLYISVVNGLSGFTGTPLLSRLMGSDGYDAFQRSEMAFAQTFERCQALPGISTGSYLERLEVLRSVLKTSSAEDGMEAIRQIYIAEPSASSEYYTAISKSKWFLSERPFLVVVDSEDDEGVLKVLTPKFEEDRARLLPFFDTKLDNNMGMSSLAEAEQVRYIDDVKVGNKSIKIEFISWPEEQSPYSVLLDHIHSTSSRSSGTQIHFDPAIRSFIPWGIAQEIQDRQLEGWRIDVAGKEILSIRERKSEEELRLLECANEFTLQAIRRTRRKTKFGMRESQVSAILEKEFEKINMPGGEGLVLFGENAALPHGSGTDRVLTDKDLVLIDAGGSYKGYISDITRTFALENTKISETQQRLWKLVADGQQAALDAAIEEGATGSDVDAAARKLIEAEGKRKVEKHGFSHRLGHGIGLEGHESPYLVGSNDQTLLPGNTFSNEPGIYIVGELGVRLEDCWVLQESQDGKRKARMFTGPAKSLMEI